MRRMRAVGFISENKYQSARKENIDLSDSKRLGPYFLTPAPSHILLTGLRGNSILLSRSFILH